MYIKSVYALATHMVICAIVHTLLMMMLLVCVEAYTVDIVVSDIMN